ncbi:hypothetical protein MH928_06250 [Flavobacterium sp. WW92]|uniref:hypothetical protein n=1 Tax=Flavobacterium sp. WW92 TaxID=1454066 RepID=UPI002377D57B|nr:hypothetical protein [Flavobacterium sp. WW92]WDO14298.1 hypothetical protein MH928_06250 [Flavobacterium sp. WW92]
MLKVWKSGKRGGYFCTRNQATFLPSTETEGLKKIRKRFAGNGKGSYLCRPQNTDRKGPEGPEKKRFKIFFKSLAGSENNRTFAPASREAKE